MGKNEGIIILLNGPSSVGKTTLQKAVQKQSKLFFLRAGIDTFFDALIEEPNLSLFQQEKKFDQYTSEGELIRSITLRVDINDHPIVSLKIGPAGDRIISGMHHALAAYAKAGNHLIIDYILYTPSWIDDLVQSLQGCKAYLVGVHAPLEVIEQREKNRSTSPCGHARSHYDTVHTGMIYDLEIDTNLSSIEECTTSILQMMTGPPTALVELSRKCQKNT